MPPGTLARTDTHACGLAPSTNQLVRILTTGDVMQLPALQHIAVATPHFKNVDMLEDLPAIRSYLADAESSIAVQRSSSGHAAIVRYWLDFGIPVPSDDPTGKRT